METKICNTCKLEKDASVFKKHRKDCKGCIADKKRIYNAKNKDKIKISARKYKEKYYAENKERLNAISAANYVKNRERIKAKTKEYSKKNPEKIRTYRIKVKDRTNARRRERRKIDPDYRERVRRQSREHTQKPENKAKVKAYHKIYLSDPDNFAKARKSKRKWFLENKDDVNTQNKIRKQVDPAYKIKCVLRARLRMALMGKMKADKTMNLLGCSAEEAVAHLESQFKEGMTWKNHGRYHPKIKRWHIDHIIPCDYYDFLNPDHQRKCFHYTNLQPLWAIENLKKSSKIPE